VAVDVVNAVLGVVSSRKIADVGHTELWVMAST